MELRTLKKIYLLLVIALGFTITSLAQESDSSEFLSVYLDCRSCDGSFIRSEINFINFVRDQSMAQVHLLVTSVGTGSGGREFTIEFRGLGEFDSIDQTLTYTTFDSDTYDEERNGLVRTIKLGFIPYMTSSNSLRNFDLRYNGNSNINTQTTKKDPWNNWIFEVGGRTWFSGEENSEDLFLNGRIRINKTTEDIKIRLNYDENFSREVVRSTDGDGNKSEDVFTVKSRNAFGMLAFSLNNHWSVGAYSSYGTSTRDNIDFRLGATPTIEYSFYPYSEFARREVTLRYGVFGSYFDYTERTIFGEIEEFLVRQELNFNMDYTKPWGGVEARLNARSYVHDFSKNRIGSGVELDMRIVRGVNVNFEVNYEWINDQLSISAEGVTDKEAIADTRQQLTSYRFWGSVGFEVTFGSIYNNVVNTRL